MHQERVFNLALVDLYQAFSELLKAKYAIEVNKTTNSFVSHLPYTPSFFVGHMQIERSVWSQELGVQSVYHFFSIRIENTQYLRL